MELRELQFFVVSVDAGSLSQAAQILYTTQPHVSKTIKKLERTLGYQLLERSKKGVELTKEGEKVYDQARKMLSSMEEIQRIQMETQESTIRIASMPSSLLSEEFVCYEETLEKIIHHICHRQVEVGFVFISKMQRQAFERMIQKRKMTFTPLKEKDMALYVGPNHPYYEKEYVTKEELRNLRYVQHEEDQISLLHTSGHLQEDLIDSRDFQQIVTVNSSSLMQELLRKTDLANLSCNLQKEKERDSLIRMIPIRKSRTKVCFGYLHRADCVLRAHTEEYLKQVEEKLK